MLHFKHTHSQPVIFATGCDQTYLHDEIEDGVQQKISNENAQEEAGKVVWLSDSSKDGAGRKRETKNDMVHGTLLVFFFSLGSSSAFCVTSQAGC